MKIAMKKIFNILMIAAVALGAVACQNDINDDVTPEQNGESVSITVSIAETRVALGEAVDGQLPLVFELNDQLCVSDNWGGYGDDRDFWFTCTAADVEKNTYTFTCEKEGVGAIVGTKKNVFYFGGAPAGNGAVCNTELESIKGVGMSGGTDEFGTDPISLDVNPVLKLTADFPVTLEASTGTFSSSKGRWATSYTTTTTGTIYVPMYSDGKYDLSVVVKGQTVKKASGFTFAKNKIYNLGTIEEPEEVVADGDPAGIEITIDGVFTDWNNITKNVATLPVEATEKTNIKTLKAYADANNIYGYVEFAEVEDNVKFVMGIDLDNDSATGSSNWLLTNVKGCELIISSGTFIEDKTFALYSAPFAWANYSVGDKTMVTSTGATSIGAGLAAVEFAIARETLNEYMTSPNIGLGITTYGTGDKKLGTMPYADKTALVIPVHN